MRHGRQYGGPPFPYCLQDRADICIDSVSQIPSTTSALPAHAPSGLRPVQGILSPDASFAPASKSESEARIEKALPTCLFLKVDSYFRGSPFVGFRNPICRAYQTPSSVFKGGLIGSIAIGRVPKEGHFQPRRSSSVLGF